MAVKYYTFQSQAFYLQSVADKVPAAATIAQVSGTPGGTSMLILSADDAYEDDLLDAMAAAGFTLIDSDALAPAATGQIRNYGSLAADPASPPFPAPAAGDTYWNTTSKRQRVYDGASWVDVSISTAVLSWGNGSISSTVTTRYLTPWADPTLAQVSAVQYRVPRAGVIRNLRVRQNGATGNANPVVYTLRVNGVASVLTASVAANANDGSDLVNSVTVAAGDLLDIEVTKALDVATSPTGIMAVMEFA